MNKNVLKMAVATVVVGVTTVVGGHLADAQTINVAQGDTLSKIASENNTSVDKIAQDNNISNINLIYVGQQLEVGEGGTTAAPVAQTTQTAQTTTTTQSTQVSQAPANTQSTYTTEQSQTTSTSSSSEQQAKDWIAQKESGGSYSAVSSTGKYIGRYQLTNSYLNGDYSAANQERVADSYVQSRYGSWSNAKAHHEQYGWY
ncbi:LysM peptidoglycan-binding domain-containing protein [Listeria costaricensis]|uniref:aggregation-promoting factor n=1 Tax=Listeria costaricensis TaxID=2026604 RepID=UPI000C086639|nr:LysM peptidoglycan-binding domain-containing protein [Listeria costaricensis]